LFSANIGDLVIIATSAGGCPFGGDASDVGSSQIPTLC
jgi:hypothetical protein